ncbi:MerR family transcriptional regulator [Neobacillus sp. YIM B02564]|uniref:MerR family transcriptional regulator n=1 Tax=Neobacillus paridis TaxID=2803862 RepID=A0ABS1TSD7_9BACI|nr:MerR family transcriptional regulator [Neobacillus paridis]MBL4953959.1 MerR family transcriptional regulator [Neobacillus paridis]
MKTYTLKEVAKKINIAPGIIRKWEKELKEVIEIPRTKQGARIYTDTEIDLLINAKKLYDQKLSKETIRLQLQRKSVQEESVDESVKVGTSLEVIDEPISASPVNKEVNEQAHLFFEAIDTYKNHFIHEVKEEIRHAVRKDVIEEVRKEISKGTLTTVKSISDAIYKSSAKTQAEIEHLSKAVEKNADLTADKLQYLAHNIKSSAIETSDDIFTLTKQLTDSTNAISHFINDTNDELANITEAISLDREFFAEERQQYLHEIRQREAAFLQMLANFRDVAAAKEKKWWKFWS